MKATAIFSPDRKFRYFLTRTWDANAPLVAFICLNPSTADEFHDDPTVRRCLAYARDWGYGGLLVANLFALRTTDPRGLRKVHDPVGPDNDTWIKRAAARSDLCIAAWGNGGRLHGRGRIVRNMLPHLHCLGVNHSGEPAHPLYLPRGRRPFPLP